MSNKRLVVALVVVAVIATIGLFVPKSREVVREVLGASPGPDRTERCESTNGVRRCWARQKLYTATTTPCNIRMSNATTTLVFSSIDITTPTSTAVIFTLATSTVSNATTSPLFITTLASGQLRSYAKFATSTSGANAAAAGIAAPNAYLAWGAEGFAPADVTKLNGWCQAEWIEL